MLYFGYTGKMKDILKEKLRTGKFMRADPQLLEELRKLKLCKKESYAEVIKRIIEKDKRKLK